MIKTILVLKIKKLDSLIVLAFSTFLDIKIFLDLDLGKFWLFNLAKILIILFLLFFNTFIFIVINTIFLKCTF